MAISFCRGFGPRQISAENKQRHAADESDIPEDTPDVNTGARLFQRVGDFLEKCHQALPALSDSRH
ncbi:MAG: hypothetical protein WB822_21010 [Rhodoplanes sp.]